MRTTLRIAVIAMVSWLSSCASAPAVRTSPPVVIVRPDPQAAAQLSLAEAKETVQRWKRWTESFGDSVSGEATVEFSATRITYYTYPLSGAKSTFEACPFESQAFDPQYRDGGARNFQFHKGTTVFAISVGSACLKLVVTIVPNREAAQAVLNALFRWKISTLAEREALARLEQHQFAPIVAQYLASNPRPTITEDVRRFDVIARAATNNKRFADAVNDYEDGLKLAPWWPEGHFNAALTLGDLHYYDEAIDHLKKYLALVPNAPDARAVQDRIYVWESEEAALPQPSPSTSPIHNRPVS
jgi:tetratricopeptide (TPR) repeat protein